MMFDKTRRILHSFLKWIMVSYLLGVFFLLAIAVVKAVKSSNSFAANSLSSKSMLFLSAEAIHTAPSDFQALGDFIRKFC